jgi:hypothetical protein
MAVKMAANAVPTKGAMLVASWARRLSESSPAVVAARAIRREQLASGVWLNATQAGSARFREYGQPRARVK